jgi:tetratricopeptide (TPR) repeat protein
VIPFIVETASAQVAEVLDPATRQYLDTAIESERTGDFDKAIAAYRLVLTRDPDFAPAALGLARCYAATGERDKARAIYEALPYEADAIEGLARLVEPGDAMRALALYERLERLDPTDTNAPLQVARLAVASDPDKAIRAYDFALGLLGGAEPDGQAVMAIALGLWARGREDAAGDVLTRYLERWPDGSVAAEARGRLDRWTVELRARELGVGGAEALDSADRKALADARRRLAAGDDRAALEILQGVVARAPNAPEAWGALAEVLLASEKVDEAERSLLWAGTLAPDDAEWPARLGLLYAEHYAGRRHREAKEALATALALRPTWTELQFELGEVELQLGDWDAASASFEAYVAAEPAGLHVREAKKRIEDLHRTTTVVPLEPQPSKPIEGVPDDVLERYRVAVVYHRKQDWAAARKEIDEVLRVAPGWPAALDLLASLELHAGNEDKALAAWERSLAADPEQPKIRVARAEVLRHRGDRAAAKVEHERAAEMGDVDASYYLAAMAWEDNEPFEAQAHLDRFLGSSTPDHLLRPLAGALDEQVERRIVQVKAAAVGGGSLLGFVGLGLLVRRFRRGQSLDRLVAASPEVVHDVVRTLSAIRHEVLKHNTTLLDELPDALEHGDFHAVSWAAVRLYGDEVTPGILDRFEAYLASLERLGRRHGVRLDLRRVDPILAPMWKALRKLQRLEKDLRAPARARPGTAEELRSLSRALNEDGYQALGRFLRRIGAVNVTRELFLGVDERVRNEAAFAEVELPTLDVAIPPEGIPLRVLAGDLEDVTANLLRNAYSALLEKEPSARRVSVSLAEEADPITGLEEVVLSFYDNAPGVLTTEMIRSRNIGRGLGLALDLVTRHDGSLRVRTVAEGKHVEVRLPRAEVAK